MILVGTPDDIIDSDGESVTYKSISRVANDHGDPTETVTSSSINAMVQWEADDGEIMSPGRVPLGRGRVFFKSTQSVAAGDRFVLNSKEYKILSVSTPRHGGGSNHTEARFVEWVNE